MKLLIDANILLDVPQKRELHYQEAAVIWKLCETEHVFQRLPLQIWFM